MVDSEDEETKAAKIINIGGDKSREKRESSLDEKYESFKREFLMASDNVRELKAFVTRAVQVEKVEVPPAEPKPDHDPKTVIPKVYKYEYDLNPMQTALPSRQLEDDENAPWKTLFQAVLTHPGCKKGMEVADLLKVIEESLESYFPSSWAIFAGHITLLTEGITLDGKRVGALRSRERGVPELSDEVFSVPDILGLFQMVRTVIISDVFKQVGVDPKRFTKVDLQNIVTKLESAPRETLVMLGKLDARNAMGTFSKGKGGFVTYWDNLIVNANSQSLLDAASLQSVEMNLQGEADEEARAAAAAKEKADAKEKAEAEKNKRLEEKMLEEAADKAAAAAAAAEKEKAQKEQEEKEKAQPQEKDLVREAAAEEKGADAAASSSGGGGGDGGGGAGGGDGVVAGADEAEPAEPEDPFAELKAQIAAAVDNTDYAEAAKLQGQLKAAEKAVKDQAEADRMAALPPRKKVTVALTQDELDWMPWNKLRVIAAGLDREYDEDGTPPTTTDEQCDFLNFMNDYTRKTFIRSGMGNPESIVVANIGGSSGPPQPGVQKKGMRGPNMFFVGDHEKEPSTSARDVCKWRGLEVCAVPTKSPEKVKWVPAFSVPVAKKEEIESANEFGVGEDYVLMNTSVMKHMMKYKWNRQQGAVKVPFTDNVELHMRFLHLSTRQPKSGEMSAWQQLEIGKKYRALRFPDKDEPHNGTIVNATVKAYDLKFGKGKMKSLRGDDDDDTSPADISVEWLGYRFLWK